MFSITTLGGDLHSNVILLATIELIGCVLSGTLAVLFALLASLLVRSANQDEDEAHRDNVDVDHSHLGLLPAHARPSDPERLLRSKCVVLSEGATHDTSLGTCRPTSYITHSLEGDQVLRHGLRQHSHGLHL